MNNNFDTAYFAGGCFWCTEAIFKKIKGVVNVIPGYTGGTVNNPNYSIVSKGYTDHAEAVKITYDPKAIKYDQVSSYSFDVKESLLERIIHNLDDVDITLKHKEQIEAYELSRRQQRPWLFDYCS